MLLAVCTVDEDIIKVDDTKVIYKAGQGLVDVGLECCWCIRQSEWHHQIFEVAVSRAKRSLLAVLALDRDAMVGVFKVHLAEDLGTS